MISNLYADIGYHSLSKYKNSICGDHVEMIEQQDGSIVIVLADGLGSGVKASILSTLTSTIISRMIAENLPIEDCVRTIAAALPICSVRNLAYSTFTIIRIMPNNEVEIIQYDSPDIILIRNGKNMEIPFMTSVIEEKSINFARTTLQENDILIAVSDGAIHAGVGPGMSYDFGWKRENIISYMESFYDVGFTAKTLNTILLDECYRLYGGKLGDDTTACTIRIRQRESVNLIIGPPSNREDCDKMMSLFFSKEGKHIVCGGTTSSIAAKYLDKPLKVSMEYDDPDIPAIGEIEGVDLVTEGVITINKVLYYAKNYLEDNGSYVDWGYKRDGASKIARILFEDSTDINFFVGRAVNPAHQNPGLPINFSIKMQLVKELSDCLKKMGKHIKVSYF
ncbi:SpoIIE family protein phosphatase [Tissierella sp.]|uniref:SpoIIE family protein phosphatase n=1 Tax=Tissierella sp. TaxID=41274 RepID=UPI002865CDD3|nr:SpoIIE family protein phosphatase [Tissierella sp.]MDR7857405.1 SpoIIE family protein phosphatase [Tissierella sp.]